MTAGKVLRYALAGSIPARVIPVILGDFPLLDTVICGDCLEELPAIPEDSIDAIVTDPPYELTSGNSKKGFMGKAWDGTGIAYNKDMWAGCLRVLKPGGHMLAFGGTRTYHRMACAIEDAGFEIRDSLHWIYGSGFPKSLDISKALDKMAGATREPILDSNGNQVWTSQRQGPKSMFDGGKERPATYPATYWNGWGTALKPAHEPLVLARKPLSESTIAGNVLKHGTGGLNIDGCRIGTDERLSFGSREIGDGVKYSPMPKDKQTPGIQNQMGRFPANLIWSHSPLCKRIGTKKVKGSQLDHVCSRKSDNGIYHPYGTQHRVGYTDADGMEEVESWDCHPSCPSWQFAKAGVTKSGAMKKEVPAYEGESTTGFLRGRSGPSNQHGDSGSVSRFFKSCQFTEEDIPAFVYYAKAGRAERNGSTHPTMKPVALMRYLCRLICPPNGTILDPFGGSGTTGLAAKQEGFHYILIEREPEYVEIARRRIASVPTKITAYDRIPA